MCATQPTCSIKDVADVPPMATWCTRYKKGKKFSFGCSDQQMSSYVEFAVNGREDVPETISESLRYIDSMDQAVTSLSASIDSVLASVQGKNRATKKQVAGLQATRQLITEVNDKKAQMVVASYDLLDHNVRMMDEEIKLLEKAMTGSGNAKLREAATSRFQVSNPIAASSTLVKGAVGSFGGIDQEAMKVDPNEPVYCRCRQVAFGDMIACDNEDCAIEWFHFQCVNLTKMPRNKWLCSDCVKLKKLEKKAIGQGNA